MPQGAKKKDKNASFSPKPIPPNARSSILGLLFSLVLQKERTSDEEIEWLLDI
jgi:hypothetical protein